MVRFAGMVGPGGGGLRSRFCTPSLPHDPASTGEERLREEFA